MRTALLFLVLLLAGCANQATLTKDLATGACITATTGSLSLTNSAGVTVFTKAAETLVFCPPAIVANAPTVTITAPAKAASAP